jgi:hypothetical protein
MSDSSPASAQKAVPTGLLIGVGGILLFLGFYISAFLVPDVIKAASGPESMTLQEAAEVAGPTQTYARLENGTWDCATLTHVRRLVPSYRRYASRQEETSSTEIFFTEDSRQVVAFVTLSGEVECNDLTGEVPAGYLYAMSDDTRQELTNDARLARYFEAESFLEFCGYCGRDNSLIGAIFGVAFTILGGAMIIYGRRLRNRSIAVRAGNLIE